MTTLVATPFEITPRQALDGAIGILGRKGLADICGVSYSAIGQWKSEGVPKSHCEVIEQKTGGVITAFMLRPDIFKSPYLSTDSQVTSALDA